MNRVLLASLLTAVLLAGVYLARNSKDVYGQPLPTVDRQTGSFNKVPIKPTVDRQTGSFNKVPIKPTESFKKVSDEPCTFSLFRRAYEGLGYFPSGGRWIDTDGVPHYQPDVCKFQYARVPRAFVAKCLSKANISFILTVGDSTGSRYGVALRKTSGLKFVQIRSEKRKDRGFLPDIDYFAKHLPAELLPYVKAKYRLCRGCTSNLNKATFVVDGNKSHSLTVEHVAQTRIVDDFFKVDFPSKEETDTILHKFGDITPQKLMFNYYLRDRYPDVFLIFLPFSHAKSTTLLSELATEIEYFKNIADDYFPNSTKFVYMPVYREFDEVKKAAWKKRRFEGMLATEKMDKMNHVLFDVLRKDLLRPKARHFAFLDLIEASKGRGQWCIDGVHMKPIWYESVMSMFWETYCNSVLKDEF